PRLRPNLDQALADSLSEIPEGNGKLFGRDLGRFVADQTLAWRRTDGMDRKLAYSSPSAPGIWERTPPDFAEPVLPQWPYLMPFASDLNRAAHPKDPPKLTDQEYTVAFKEVKELGAKGSKKRTKDQTEIALF